MLQLINKPDENVYKKEFDKYLAAPKPVKYMAEGYKVSNGEQLSWDISSTQTVEEIVNNMLKEGSMITKIVPSKGNHWCKYCGAIAYGSQKDALCGDCQERFGHYLYNEL